MVLGDPLVGRLLQEVRTLRTSLRQRGSNRGTQGVSRWQSWAWTGVSRPWQGASPRLAQSAVQHTGTSLGRGARQEHNGASSCRVLLRGGGCAEVGLVPITATLRVGDGLAWARTGRGWSYASQQCGCGKGSPGRSLYGDDGASCFDVEFEASEGSWWADKKEPEPLKGSLAGYGDPREE